MTRGPAGIYQKETGGPEITFVEENYHQVELVKLEPGTRYRYSLSQYGADVSGSFSTSPASEQTPFFPYVPLSHPFVERLIGTIRRECLDRTLFWTSADLENKLLDFRSYFNDHRTHTSREGRTPDEDTRRPRPVADLNCYRWQPHCRGLYQTPIAA